MRLKNSAIIAILLILAIALAGVIYYKQYWPKDADSANNGNPAGDEQPAPREIILSDPEFDANLTEQQKALFYNPGPDATQEQKDAYFRLAEAAATPGTLISINGCTASPDVLKVQLGSDIKVKNTGTTDIRFGVSSEKVTVKAGATVEISDLFTQGTGLYGYGCDNPGVRRAIGMVLVTP